MSELSTRYTPGKIEEKWYKEWIDKEVFRSVPDEREAYTVVIPPPNVTGVLHMGHMLNNSIQDILVRKARLDGYNACWVPGTDHASIATEARVVHWLREQDITKGDLSRDEFIDYAWQWTEKYGGIILEQLKKLGASCDWSRTSFTMDEVRSDQVIQAFVDLYNRGKLYRGLRMVNWDPEAKTVLSNEEVIYKEEQSKLYHVRYPIAGSDEGIVIATTRPETILANTGVAIHPNDERYQNLKGKKVIIPITGREVPIVFDDFVEMDFGTGALKVTPGHDPNDYEIGLKHNLEVIEIFTEDAKLNKAGLHYEGQDRFEVRKNIVRELKEKGFLVKVEDYVNQVGRSERTDVVVEPRLSLQWYVDMKSLAEPALEAVMKDEVEFFPANMKNTYRHWMENIRDWCISRQLWWGHRIPAWYYKDEVFVAKDEEGALALAREKFPDEKINPEDLTQDEDVLDTWFSSWLWPISVFDGFEDVSDIYAYYPTNVLVTGWDIIFLWVARMIMAGYEWKEQMPFKDVYFTGMVRDSQRRKMSKSLGNSPDALKLIDDYGADAVRYGLLSFSPAGGDLLYDEQLLEQGRNFANKIWNAFRLAKSFEVSDDVETPLVRSLAVNWINDAFNALLEEIEADYAQYRLSHVAKKLYSFIWSEFCSWYLEMIKPAYGEKLDNWSYVKTIEIFEKIMIVLHPFMPFLTEEIYQSLKERQDGDDCIVAGYPKQEGYDSDFIKVIDTLKELISNVREQRNTKGIPMREALKLSVLETEGSRELFAPKGRTEFIRQMAHLSEVNWVKDAPDSSVSFISGSEKYFLEIGSVIDVEKEREKVLEELEYARGFLKSVEKKLSNERFVAGAPEQVVLKERQKLEDGQKRVARLEETLKNLG